MKIVLYGLPCEITPSVPVEVPEIGVVHVPINLSSDALVLDTRPLLDAIADFYMRHERGPRVEEPLSDSVAELHEEGKALADLSEDFGTRVLKWLEELKRR